ncbi:MAG: acyl-CoA dehydrogenase family protein, partial [Pseudolabrys sp.]
MQLSEDQRQIRATARDFARAEIVPAAAQWDRDAAFPAAAVRT